MSRSTLDASKIATARMPGFDVARAFAIFGMVVVNVHGQMGNVDEDSSWLLWLSARLEGRAAALFVVLAGVGIALRSKRARANPSKHLAFERSALLRRAAFLAVAGVLHLHMWEWDILHCYAVFLALAAGLLSAPGWLLWLLALGFVGGEVALQSALPYEPPPEIWTLDGSVSSVFFNGLHPVFPWMAFLLIGMWLGRLDLDDAALRRRVLLVSVLAILLGELPDSTALRAPEWLELDETQATWVTNWPRPPLPLFVVAATGTAAATICLCIGATRRRARAKWVVALTATGQLAFTLYIAHAVAILIPLQHGLLMDSSIELCLAYSLLFCAGAIAASVWWRRRFPHGPLEAVIRQLTGRTTPAPWGGELASGDKD